MVVAHIACINLSNETGMGRIAANWKHAFEVAGHSFLHIGRMEVGSAHMLIWGKKAAAYCKEKNINADVWLVHEPFGGDFASLPGKLVIFSHGIEERAWDLNKHFRFEQLSFKARLLPDWIRFYSHRKGFRYAELCLLSNSTDLKFLKKRGVQESRLYIFKNGYHSFRSNLIDGNKHSERIRILYNGTWIPRKGIDTIIDAFNDLFRLRKDIELMLIGTAFSSEEVLHSFLPEYRDRVYVISHFKQEEEIMFLKTAQIFLLPSYLEGQSVALTQAMALGLCPVVSDNSGQLDFVVHNQNGMLFKTGSARDLTEKINYLLNTPSLIVSMGKVAASSVSELDWPKVTGDIVRQVEDI